MHVVTTIPFLTEQQKEQVRFAAPGVSLRHVVEPGGIAEAMREAEVLFGASVPDDLSASPRLRWVQVSWAGVEHVMNHPIMQGEVKLTNASGTHAIPIAEHVLGMMLSFTRKLRLMDRWQSRHYWPEKYEESDPAELYGKTVAIAGLGNIGQRTAQVCHPLGMRLLGAKASLEGGGRPLRPEVSVLFARLYPREALTEMVAEADFVVLAVPLTPASRGMLGERELRAMKSTAVLINIARGGLVDEQALIRALREGWIAGAGLDVFTQEPLPKDSPLWSMENVLITPHIAGGDSEAVNQRVVDLFCENLARFAASRPLLNLVDRGRGY